MIELRWALQHRGYIEKERVLQYRVKDSWSAHDEEPDWGQWQDVPEVDVPNHSSPQVEK